MGAKALGQKAQGCLAVHYSLEPLLLEVKRVVYSSLGTDYIQLHFNSLRSLSLQTGTVLYFCIDRPVLFIILSQERTSISPCLSYWKE